MSYAAPPRDDDEALPSYEAAISRNPLPLIARYLPPGGLFPLLLVSKAYYASFKPPLYSCPHLSFGLGEHSALQSFLLFLRTLQLSPAIPHTTHLSLNSVQASIYTSLPTSWLQVLLTKLPNLQHLNVSHFPFFDRAALLSLTTTHPHLTTLIAANCPNTTADSLSHALTLLPALITLDLSSTTSAPLHTIAALPALHHLYLRSQTLTTITPLLRLGTRLQTLDLRHNLLPSSVASDLLNHCFSPPTYTGIPTASSGGLTSLLLSDNPISVAAVQTLLQSGRLTTLDIGGIGDGSLAGALSVYSFASLVRLRCSAAIVMDPQGLKRGVLSALRELVLTGLQEWEDPERVSRLCGFVTRGGDALRCVELEIVEGAELEEGEFSFWEGREVGKGKVETLEAVKMARGGKRWGVRVRVWRDLGGRESVERGEGGERWGVVREGV